MKHSYIALVLINSLKFKHMKRTKYYRMKGDRKYFTSDYRELVERISIAKKLQPHETNHLLLHGISEDGKIEIQEFFSK